MVKHKIVDKWIAVLTVKTGRPALVKTYQVPVLDRPASYRYERDADSISYGVLAALQYRTTFPKNSQTTLFDTELQALYALLDEKNDAADILRRRLEVLRAQRVVLVKCINDTHKDDRGEP